MVLETTNDNINYILILLVFNNDQAFTSFSKSTLSKTSEEHVAIINASNLSSAIVDSRQFLTKKHLLLATDTGMVKSIQYPFKKIVYLYCLSVKNLTASWIVSASLSAMDSQTTSHRKDNHCHGNWLEILNTKFQHQLQYKYKCFSDGVLPLT